jgi:acetoin:2,6-dichlorophenolindophenol oxidoreductase subunit alpha
MTSLTHTASKVDRDLFRKGFRYMALARRVEDRLASLYRAGGKIVGGVYLGKGQEAFSVALPLTLIKGTDVYGPLIRDQPGRLAFGEPVLDTFQTYFGSALGIARGRDGNVHRGRPRDGMPAMISHLGALVSVVSGMVFARRLKGHTRLVGATSIGDGATSTGAFHEALNLAAVERIPLVVAVANNQFAYSTPTTRQFACRSLVDRAIGYGIEGYEVDGTDLAACLETFATATARARDGHGPQLVVGNLLRLTGHGEHDDASYVPDELRLLPQYQDPVPATRQRILELGWATEQELAAWELEDTNTIDQAVSIAAQDPKPDPYQETWQALSRQDLLDTYH